MCCTLKLSLLMILASILSTITTTAAANIFLLPTTPADDSSESPRSSSQNSNLPILLDGSFRSNHGTSLIHSDATCRNSHEWSVTSKDGNIVDCGDIHFEPERRRVQFCAIEEVRTNCPITCGLCCEDDPTYYFQTHTGVNTNCESLSDLEWFQSKHFCNTLFNGMMVRASCPKACSYCKHYVSLAPSVTPSISMSPTDVPTSDPTSIPTVAPFNARSIAPTNSAVPSSRPERSASFAPTETESNTPSTLPTESSKPSSIKSHTPSIFPTKKTIDAPSALPIKSNKPSSTATHKPTSYSPSRNPSSSPSFMQSRDPSTSPTLKPSPNSSTTPTDQPTLKNPNLVMIITDEHNLKTLSCYRNYLLSKYSKKNVDVWGINLYLDTPNIDSLARDGALFANFYTTSPLCTPSRASFMTGMYPPFTGNADLNHGELDTNLKTFASILRDERGYSTSYIGKWHLDGKEKPVSYSLPYTISTFAYTISL